MATKHRTKGKQRAMRLIFELLRPLKDFKVLATTRGGPHGRPRYIGTSKRENELPCRFFGNPFITEWAGTQLPETQLESTYWTRLPSARWAPSHRSCSNCKLHSCATCRDQQGVATPYYSYMSLQYMHDSLSIAIMPCTTLRAEHSGSS
jgi:hypothetical protein